MNPSLLHEFKICTVKILHCKTTYPAELLVLKLKKIYNNIENTLNFKVFVSKKQQLLFLKFSHNNVIYQNPDW